MRTLRPLDFARGRRTFIIGVLPFAAAMVAAGLHAQDATITRPAPAAHPDSGGASQRSRGRPSSAPTAPPVTKGPGRIRRRQAST